MEFPVNHRGKCPTCGSPNLHHSFTAAQFLRELATPQTAVLCRVCPDVWVLPIWETMEAPIGGETVFVPEFHREAFALVWPALGDLTALEKLEQLGVASEPEKE